MPEFLQQVNWVDLVVAGVWLRLGWMGLTLGLGVELTKGIAALSGVFIAFRWYQWVGDWVAARTFLTHEWAGALLLVSLAAVTYLIMVLGLRALQKLVTMRFAPALDKVGGLAAGLLRAALVSSVLLVGLQQLPSEYLRLSIEERSWSGRPMVRVAPAVYDAVMPVVTQWWSHRLPPDGEVAG